MRHVLVLALLALAPAGCALGPGEPMGVLEPTLTAHYALHADREAEGGFQRLATDYQVHITRAELGVGPLALVAQSGSGTGTFDEAHPPPGYSLCHNGHCHADDGRLVSYEDIAAALGGGATTRTVVALQAPAAIDLLAGGPLPLSCQPEDCVLPAADIQRLSVPVRRLVLEGVVQDGRAESEKRFDGQRSFTFALDVPADGDAPLLTSDLELPVDREHAPVIRLGVGLELSAALFDHVDWAVLAGTSESIELSSTASTASTSEFAKVLQALSERTVLSGDVERSVP